MKNRKSPNIVLPLVQKIENLLQIPTISQNAWQNSPPIKRPISNLNVENFSEQKLENINKFIKSFQGVEIPKSMQLKNKVKNEKMFEKIKNIY